MKFSLVQAVQWVGAALVILVLVGLNWDLESEAGMRLNSSVDDSLSQGIRGYWKLDDGTGTNATDSSGNGNTLAMTGSPSWVAGNIGPYSLDFSGTGQYLSVADPASGVLDFAAGASFSLTGWFNRSRTFDSDDTLIAKRNGQAASDDGYIVYIDDSTDTLVFEASDTDDGDEYQQISSTTFTAAGWHQFAVTWNDSVTTGDPVNIYIDGGLNNGAATGTFANIGDLTESVAFRIGAESDAGVPFDGKLDDIRVYGYPLSASEVLKLYQTTAPAQPVDTGLVGHWTFDGPDIKGTTAIDRSGKGNNGTRTGTTPTIGKLGQALSFNGTSDYVDVSADIIGTGADSITAWIYQRSYTDLFAQIVSNGKTDFLVGTSENKQLLLSSNGSITIATSDFDAIPLNEWAFVAGTRSSSGTANLYINGVLTGGANQSSGTPAGGLGGIGLGGGFSYSFDGSIDDVRVYNRELSATEIANLYNLGR